MKKYLIKLSEDLTFQDLIKNKGLSDFTLKYKNKRQQIKGPGNKSAKIINIKVNKKKDYLIINFLSEPTYDFETKVTQGKKMTLVKDNLYTQQIKILRFFSNVDKLLKQTQQKELTRTQIKTLLNKALIQLWCDCPSMWWQGLSYNLTQQFNGSIHPNNIKPKYWSVKHGNKGVICKHLQLIINSIDFWLNPITLMVNKYLKKNGNF